MFTRLTQNHPVVNPITTTASTVPMAGEPTSGNREVTTVRFSNSIATSEKTFSATPSVPPIPTPGSTVIQPAMSIPRWVSWSSVLAAQAACLLLLGAIFFMPHAVGETGWWTDLKAGSLAGALPGALKFVEIVGSIVGLILIPLFRGDARGRFMLNVSASLTILLILAMLQQNLIGINLVVLPIAGLLSLAALSAVLHSRTLATKSESLGIWQFLFSLAVIVMWILPSIQAASDPTFAEIFVSMGGPILRGIFVLGGVCALLAGVVAIAESQGKFSLLINRIARGLTLMAFLLISFVGLATALSISHVMAGPAMTKGWFGVGVMWLFMLITACVMLTWAGLTHQFCRKAVNADYHESTAVPATLTAQA